MTGRAGPLLRQVAGKQTNATTAATSTAATPSPQKSSSTSLSRAAAAQVIRSTTPRTRRPPPPPPPELTEAQLNASPKSSSGSEAEESAVDPGQEEEPQMSRQEMRYSDRLSPRARKNTFRPPQRQQNGGIGAPQRSGIGGSPRSLKREPVDDIMDDFGFQGRPKKSKGYGSKDAVYKNGARNGAKYPKLSNFHAKGKGGANGSTGVKSSKDDSDSDAESQLASARKPLSNTTNTPKIKSLSSPQSDKKTKGRGAKLHIIGDPDTLSAPVSSYASSGLSPARSIKSTKSEHSPNSDLSSPPSSAQLEEDELELEYELNSNPNGNYDRPAKCPMCAEPVDAGDLSSWQRRVGRAGISMRIADQIAFCEAHKIAEAQQEYDARSYPSIDFDALPARIEHFRDDLLAILHETRPSHFREKTSAAASRGELRNINAAQDMKQMNRMSVGYYGPRGRRIMEAWVTTHLGDKVRERAGSDRLIGFKTPAGFMQEVLVPELATWLIMEDKRETENGEETGEARAREILEESGHVGDIVYHVVEGEPHEVAMEGDRVKVDDDGEDY